MATACLISGSWDLAKYGTLAFTFSDSSGGPYSVSLSSTIVDHDLMIGATGASGVNGSAIINDSIGHSVTQAMQALSPRTYTITLNRATGLYTWSVNSGTFSVTWVTAPELLGFTGSALSAAATQTSQKIPQFLIKPTIGGLTNDTGVFRAQDAIKSSTASSGAMYRLAPAYVQRMRSWEHWFEPKERADIDYFWLVGSTTHLYNWEQLWMDFGTALLPLGGYVLGTDGRVELWAFSLNNATYDGSTFTRMKPNDDVRFKIKIDAQLWPSTNSPTFFARVIT